MSINSYKVLVFRDVLPITNNKRIFFIKLFEKFLGDRKDDKKEKKGKCVKHIEMALQTDRQTENTITTTKSFFLRLFEEELDRVWRNDKDLQEEKMRLGNFYSKLNIVDNSHLSSLT